MEHPAATRNPVPDSLRVALFDKLVKGPLHVAKVRLQAILRIKKLQQELRAEEARFQATLPGHVEEVVKGKTSFFGSCLCLRPTSQTARLSI